MRMNRVLHVVPGMDNPCSGIAVVAGKMACMQGADVAEARGVAPSAISSADEVWVHSTWTPAVWRACRLCLHFGKRLVRMTHGNLDPMRLRTSRIKKLLAGSFERYWLRSALKIVVTCREEKSWIETYLGERCPEIEVVDLKKFDWYGGGVREVVATKKQGRPLRVLYMGRRHPLKGLQYLEEAIKQANSEFVGSSKQWNLGQTCFLPFELRVETGAVGGEKEAAFDWCDVLCLPTLSENFGIVVAEALARGKPVITTDGAPAWADEPRTDAAGNQRLVYIEGYRDAAPAVRVQMLKQALSDFAH